MQGAQKPASLGVRVVAAALAQADRHAPGPLREQGGAGALDILGGIRIRIGQDAEFYPVRLHAVETARELAHIPGVARADRVQDCLLYTSRWV